MPTYIIFSVILYIAAYIFYIKISHGLGHKAQYLQLRRFLPCAVLAVLPMFLVNQPLTAPFYLVSLLTGIAWIITYPLFYYLTYHKNSSDFGFHLDIVFGLYVIGWSASCKALLLYFDLYPAVTVGLFSVLELCLLLLPLFQCIYYLLYKTCVSDEGITLILETDNNETIEFFKSLPAALQIATPLLLLSLLAAVIYANILSVTKFAPVELPQLALAGAVLIFLTIYLWNTKKGVFIRTGFIELYLDVKNYLRETALYKTQLEQRLADLNVTSNKTEHGPSTIILVVGESASKDYMSAFSDYPHNTTPWLRRMQDNENYILFTNAYACKDQTVPVLERALTEVNQYNNIKFYEACSVIDIAKKAGYRTYWFSNQGHIGSAETAITLVANTADTAEWTKQNLNQYQYDEALLENLQKVNPAEKNFIVLHLMGSHFNFINRYPQSFAQFSQPDKYDLIPNYLDSLAYTDHLLQQITAYAQDKLNLQALVYFSDHATIPDKRRSPQFGGFANVRIPLFVYVSDTYKQLHSAVYQSLQANKDKYFTNDLIYDLLCGIFDINSNHFDEKNCLASAKYQYKREDLKTNLGKINITDDSTK